MSLSRAGPGFGGSLNFSRGRREAPNSLVEYSALAQDRGEGHAQAQTQTQTRVPQSLTEIRMKKEKAKTKAKEEESVNLSVVAASALRSYPNLHLAARSGHGHGNNQKGKAGPGRLGRIGSREEKTWFVVKIKNSEDKATLRVKWKGKEKGRGLLCLIPLRNVPLGAHEGVVFARAVVGLADANHPNILPTWTCDWLSEGGYVAICRPLLSRGSLRDLLHKASPIESFRKKYFNEVAGDADVDMGISGGTSTSTGTRTLSRTGRPAGLSEASISRIGRQVLDGMLFLEEIGYPYHHVHAGNVVIDDDSPASALDSSHFTCCLTDYESDLIGLQPRIHKLGLKSPSLDFNVYAFASLVYELATGYVLRKRKPDIGAVKQCEPGIRAFLLACFHDEAESDLGPGSGSGSEWRDDDGVVTLASLRASPFFAVGPQRGLPKPVEVSSAVPGTDSHQSRSGSRSGVRASTWSVPDALLDVDVVSLLAQRRSKLAAAFSLS